MKINQYKGFMDRSAQKRSLTIVVIYGTLGTLWILLTDVLIHWLFGEYNDITERVEIYKGLVYVLLTSILLYYLYKSQLLSVLKSSAEKTKLISELEEANRKYEHAFRATLDVLWDLDIKTKSLNYSPNFGKIFEFDPEDVPNTIVQAQAFMHPEEVEELNESFKRALKEGSDSWHKEFKHLTGTGHYAYVEARAVFVKNENGYVSRAIGTLRNITHRKKRQLEMRMMESAVDNASDAILITNALADKPNPKIVYANQAFYRLTGYSPQEVLNRSPRFLQGKDTPRKALQKIRQAIENRQYCRVKLLNYAKDGRSFWIDYSMSPVYNADNEVSHFVSVQRDITAEQDKLAHERVLRQMANALNSEASYLDRLDVIVRELTHFCDFSLGEVWITNMDNSRMQSLGMCVDKSRFPQKELEKFTRESTQPNEGLVGKVWESGDLEFFNNLSSNRECLRKASAERLGLHSAIGVPIQFGGTWVGIFMFFSGEQEMEITHNRSIVYKLSQHLSAEMLRLKTEHEQETFFELSPDALCIMDESGCLKKFSAVLEQKLGYTHEELRNRNLFDLLHPDDEGETRNAFSLLINEVSSDIFVNRVQSKKGEIFWFSWSASYAQRQGLIFAVAKDITLARKSQYEVKVLRNLQNYVINNTQDLIWAIDTNYMLTLANDAYIEGMKKITGFNYQIGEKVGSQSEDIHYYQEDSRLNWQNRYEKSFNGKNQNFTIAINTQKDFTRKYQIEISPIFELNENKVKVVTGVACHGHDITDRLSYIEKIEGQNTSLREIAWIQSHLVRAPLSRILGLADMISNYSNDPAEKETFLNDIVDSANELDEVIRQIVTKAARVKAEDLGQKKID